MALGGAAHGARGLWGGCGVRSRGSRVALRAPAVGIGQQGLREFTRHHGRIHAPGGVLGLRRFLGWPLLPSMSMDRIS